MKNLPDDLDLDDGEMLKDARVLYRHLSRVLAEAIDAIEASGHIDAKDAEHQAMVRKHHKVQRLVPQPLQLTMMPSLLCLVR